MINADGSPALSTSLNKLLSSGQSEGVSMFRKKFLSALLLMGLLISQSVPHARAQTNCDRAQFVSDLTAPDGSSFATGSAFTKTWRLMNAGTCTWNASYNLVSPQYGQLNIEQKDIRLFPPGKLNRLCPIYPLAYNDDIFCWGEEIFNSGSNSWMVINDHHLNWLFLCHILPVIYDR